MSKFGNIANLASLIKQGVKNYSKEIHTAMPGIIESFNPELQTASVQPAIKRMFKTDDGEVELISPENLPLCINVPVIFPRGGGFSLTMPVKAGDECLLIFCERSIDLWHERGSVQEPLARRFHSFSDAVAYVGLSSKVNKIPDYDPENTVIKKDDGTVYIKWNADSSLEVFAESDINITTNGDLKATVAGNMQATVTGDINVSTESSANLNATGNISVETSADASVNAAGAVSLTAGSAVNITAPTINLNGAVNISGAVAMAAGASVTGSMENNGVDIGSGHKHSGSATAPNGPVSDTGAPV